MNTKLALLAATVVLGIAIPAGGAQAKEAFGSIHHVCHWYKQQAMATGDDAAWRRFYACQRGRW